MNRIITVVLLAIAGVAGCNTAAAEDIFAGLEGHEGVNAKYVAGRFSHNMPEWRSFDRMRAFDLSRGFSALYAYDCTTKESVKKAKEILTGYLKKHPDVSLMMKNVNNGREYMLYELIGSDDGKIYQVIIWNQMAPELCSMMVVDYKKGIESSSKSKDKYNDD